MIFIMEPGVPAARTVRRQTRAALTRVLRAKRRTKNAKAFHDKCENMTLSDFY
ncbi:hypothetical protein ABLN73_20190 [Mycobacterium tuberculosis]